jgi:glucosamine--fructose-6-phosphate aminotransferase (isomerizing)
MAGPASRVSRVVMTGPLAPRLPVEVDLASEFRYRAPVLDRSTLVVAISQSGETADTLEAVRHAKKHRRQSCWRSATPTAARSRRSATRCSTPAPDRRSGGLHEDVPGADRRQLPGRAGAGAGPRHQVRRRGGPRILGAGVDADAGGAGAGRSRTHRRVGPRFALSSTVLFVGRHVGYPVALEGALKLKELGVYARRGVPRRRAQTRADRPDRGRRAGDRRDALAEELHDAAFQAAVQHRESRPAARSPFVTAEQADDTVRRYADHLFEIRSVSTLFQPLVSTTPLQVFAASVARARGYDVDKPRNLAKSVTVD